MRIVFIDFGTHAYTIDTPLREPLGASQSALCYLAETLVKKGHEVTLVNRTAGGGMVHGVQCVPLVEPHSAAVLDELALDAVIVLNAAGGGGALRSLLGRETTLVLWTQHLPDQPAMEALNDPSQCQAWDGFAMVSPFNKDGYARAFAIDPARMEILPNAVTPAFLGQFAENETIRAGKTMPPVLAYTSTPFRGLDLLLAAFPRIARAVPGVTLKVFSSLRVYQVPAEKDQYAKLYDLCRAIRGIDYVGSVAQPDLAREMRQVSVLAYPNTFVEGQCVAALEAMASGCWIVTSDLGALADTTAGFATLIEPPGDRDQYVLSFVDGVVQALRRIGDTADQAAEAHLRAQMNHINANFTWPVIADRWLAWLNRLRDRNK